jgi:hypothetical protein
MAGHFINRKIQRFYSQEKHAFIFPLNAFKHSDIWLKIEGEISIKAILCRD